MYKVNFNDIDLDEYFIITGVTRNIIPTRNNKTRKIPSMYGEVYNGFTYDAREIVLSCFLEADNEEDRIDKQTIIADILNVKEPVKVIISDDPDKFFYAVPEGSVAVSKLGSSSEFEITLKCYDVFKYALEEDYFDADNNNEVIVTNTGSVEASPKISIEFLNKANFVQVTNEDNKTILLGTRPGIDDELTSDKIIVDDDCSTKSNWVQIKNATDDLFYDLGTFSVNGGGYGLICNDYGVKEREEDMEDDDYNAQDFMKGWHGVSIKRNFNSSVDNFDLTVWLEHNSLGDVKGGGSSSATTGNYKVTSKSRLNIRSGRGTNYSILGKIPVGTIITVTDISGGWGKTTYNGVTGYVSMSCLTYVATSSSTSGNIQATCDVHVRSGAGTKYKSLTVAKKGTTATKLATSGSWYKVTVNGKTGWTHKNYWKAINSSRNASASAENRMGRIEIYGLDANGKKLFKFELKDTEKYYEYTQPVISINNEVILSENKAVPSASSNAGKYGDWNEFSGTFNIQRNNNVWSATISKYENNQVVKSIYTNKLINDKYPTTALASIVVSFGQWKDNIVVDTMNISSVVLKEVQQEENNVVKSLFWAGDVVEIDNETHQVTCNGRPLMYALDIGSQFFNSPVGNSSFRVYSDSAVEVDTSIRRKWL